MPSPLRAALGGRPIGCHLPLGGGMVKAAERADAIGAAALQVFADNPTAWRRRAEPPAELTAFLDRVHDLELGPNAVHAAYLVNLAGADEAFWERSVDVLAAELRMGAAYGATAVNVHVGSHRGAGRDTGAERLARGLARVLEQDTSGRSGPRLVLENSAGGGDGIGDTVEELAEIVDRTVRLGADEKRLGVCLDTAHLWGAGYEISRPGILDELLARFDELLGRERLAMLHLNDSKVELGSHTDRHQHVGAGKIGEVGLRHLVRHPRLAHVPIYLETPGMDEGYDAVNMERVRLLLAGEPLPVLTDEALQLRGGRAGHARAAPAAAVAES